MAQRAGKLASQNSPLILTAIGVAGTISTAILTGKASVKAYKILEHETTMRGFEYEPKEKVQLVWKQFVPPAITMVGTVACIICANRIGTRRTAAMAAAYAISQETFTEYKTKVIEKIGENKERAVRDEVAQDRVKRNPPSSDMIVVGNEAMFHEAFTGRYFKSTMEEVKSAVNRVNHHMINNFSAELNDFYDFVGLDRTDMGDMLGWNSDKLIELQFTTIMMDDQRPAISFSYKDAPRESYFRNSM